LAEDDPGLRQLVHWALEQKGYRVTDAVDGAAALEAIENNHFDLVLTDLLMPRVNGISVLEAVKACDPHTPVIIMTGTQDVSFLVRAVRSRVDDYLLKPFQMSEMCDRISRCLEDQPGRRDGTMGEAASLQLARPAIDITKIMAHDIRGCLVSLSTELKLMKRGAYGRLDGDAIRKAEELYGRSMRLMGIAEGYLRMALAAQRGEKCAWEELNLQKDVILPVLGELEIEIREEGVRLNPAPGWVSGRPVTVRSNAILLKAVYRNLFSNAIRHGGRGCTVSYGIDLGEKEYRLSVFNSGRPVPESRRDRLFDPAMPTGEDEGEPRTGLGIGLALVREIVQGFGGSIWYEPCDGGSRFLFTLPRH
jgi:CheY-like chemotaxis protein